MVRAAPEDSISQLMRAILLSGQCEAWEAGPRSAAEVVEAATHFERAVELEAAPALKAELLQNAAACRSKAEAIAGEQ